MAHSSSTRSSGGIATSRATTAGTFATQRVDTSATSVAWVRCRSSSMLAFPQCPCVALSAAGQGRPVPRGRSVEGLRRQAVGGWLVGCNRLGGIQMDARGLAVVIHGASSRTYQPHHLNHESLAGFRGQ